MKVMGDMTIFELVEMLDSKELGIVLINKNKMVFGVVPEKDFEEDKNGFKSLSSMVMLNAFNKESHSLNDKAWGHDSLS